MSEEEKLQEKLDFMTKAFQGADKDRHEKGAEIRTLRKRVQELESQLEVAKRDFPESSYKWRWAKEKERVAELEKLVEWHRQDTHDAMEWKRSLEREVSALRGTYNPHDRDVWKDHLPHVFQTVVNLEKQLVEKESRVQELEASAALAKQAYKTQRQQALAFKARAQELERENESLQFLNPDMAKELVLRKSRIAELEKEMAERLKVSNDCLDVEIDKRNFVEKQLAEKDALLVKQAAVIAEILKLGKAAIDGKSVRNWPAFEKLASRLAALEKEAPDVI